jgi:D-serine deaminase-like pyridoxal phosphate-dependent protein
MDHQIFVDALDTPSIIIDLDIMERNIASMQAHCDALGLAFRPHIKTHKIPAIAHLQLEAGAAGIACQKVSEAEVFAAAGIDDIQIPYNIVGAHKTARLANLAAYNRISVTADSEETIDGLSAAARAAGVPLRVLVELESELHRAGAPVERAVSLAQKIAADEHLHFAGVMIYPSDVSVRPTLQEALRRLDQAGIGVDVVSGGGTGAALHAAEVPELTELRVGTYVFNDWATVTKSCAAPEDCAMSIRTAIVSRPTPDRAILDAGSKSLSSDNSGGVYGHIVEFPAARIYRLNEEHAFVDLSACSGRPEVGDVVHVIPDHVCVAMNLHDEAHGVRNGLVEVTWPIAARGRVH